MKLKLPERWSTRRLFLRIVLVAICLILAALALAFRFHLFHVDQLLSSTMAIISRIGRETSALWAGPVKLFLTVARILLIFFLIVIALYIIWREYRRNPLILDPFSVPKGFEEAGLTGEVLAQRIRDRILEIQTEAISAERKSNFGAARDELTLPDVDLAGAKIGFKSFIDLLRNLTGRYLRHVTGDIILPHKFAPEKIGLRAEIIVTIYITQGRQRSSPVRLTVPAGQLSQLIDRSATTIFQMTDPLLLGHLCYSRHDYPAAETIIQDILNDTESTKRLCAEAHTLQARIHLKCKEYGRSIAACELACSIDPEYIFLYGIWGWALSGLGKHNEAIDMCRTGLKIGPKHAAVYNSWGLALYEQNELKRAIRLYRKATKIDRNFVQPLANWGVALAALGAMKEAIDKFEEALKISPKYADIYHAYANSLNRSGKYKDAIPKYEAALEFDPNLTYAYIDYGNNLVALEKYDEAIAKYKAAIKIAPQMTSDVNPKLAYAYNAWGQTLNSLGRTEEAREKLDRSQELTNQSDPPSEKSQFRMDN